MYMQYVYAKRDAPSSPSTNKASSSSRIVKDATDFVPRYHTIGPGWAVKACIAPEMVDVSVQEQQQQQPLIPSQPTGTSAISVRYRKCALIDYVGRRPQGNPPAAQW